MVTFTLYRAWNTAFGWRALAYSFFGGGVIGAVILVGAVSNVMAVAIGYALALAGAGAGTGVFAGAIAAAMAATIAAAMGDFGVDAVFVAFAAYSGTLLVYYFVNRNGLKGIFFFLFLVVMGGVAADRVPRRSGVG